MRSPAGAPKRPQRVLPGRKRTRRTKKTNNPGRYGRGPYKAAVLHGGPGAPGSAAPLARELCSDFGVLEPLQTADSLDGQVTELHYQLKEHGDLPLSIIGWSWGAMLGFVFAARYPEAVQRLILVGCGAFTEEYAGGITATRLGRLSKTGRREVAKLSAALDDPAAGDKDGTLARLGEIFDGTDAYDPLPPDGGISEVNHRIYESVWREAAALRASGELLALGKRIRCPVLALHGDYDSHPAAGVREPLCAVLDDFRFIQLENCGHRPWMERRARGEFYRILKAELR